MKLKCETRQDFETIACAAPAFDDETYAEALIALKAYAQRTSWSPEAPYRDDWIRRIEDERRPPHATEKDR